MTRSGFAALVLFALLPGSGSEALAQTAPATEDIVQALTFKNHAQTKSLSQKGIQVIEGTKDKAPSIDLTINFAYNSAKLETDSLLTLKRLSAALSDPRLASYKFTIAGHTDGAGSVAYNQHLSEMRANAVRDHLLFYYDVSPTRLAAKGYGKSRLLEPDQPLAAANRRVQVTNEGPAS